MPRITTKKGDTKKQNLELFEIAITITPTSPVY